MSKQDIDNKKRNLRLEYVNFWFGAQFNRLDIFRPGHLNII
jgi:hypothetical protein